LGKLLNYQVSSCVSAVEFH